MADEATPLAPDLAGLQAIASAADAELAGQTVVPGQEPQQQDDAALAEELGDAIALGFKMGGKLLPPLAEHFNRDACRAIAAEYLACAEKYGWTWHQEIGGPEFRLAVALGAPAIMCAVDIREYLAARRAAAESNGKAPKPAPAPPARPELSEEQRRLQGERILPSG